MQTESPWKVIWPLAGGCEELRPDCELRQGLNAILYGPLRVNFLRISEANPEGRCSRARWSRVAFEAEETRAEVQLRGSTGFSWGLWEVCVDDTRRMWAGTEILTNPIGSVCYTKDFNLETALRRCLRALNGMINIIYSAWSHNYIII